MIYIKNSLKRKKRKTEDGYDVWKWRRKKTARKPIAVSSVWTIKRPVYSSNEVNTLTCYLIKV